VSDDADRQLEEILAEHREDEETPQDDDATADPLDPFAVLDEPAATTTREAADQPAGDEDQEAAETLPDAPLFALLRTVERDLGVPRIDRIWVFPPRRLEAAETAVVVVGAFTDDSDRRRVYAAHYSALEDLDQTRLVLQEFGTAPADRVGRLVEEVVERLNDDPAGAPRSHRIDGRPDQWHTVLHHLAEAWLERAARNRRLRR
jgi:plasmid stabilization system protein ParE